MENKKKIINDPVHGFIALHSELIFDIINHPVFQRLRRIKQLGLTELVYPGASHTRFHHALGAMHLMSIALATLRSKGHEISEVEYDAALLAILLHDVGHSPFSHALEHSILDNIQHEKVSLLLMKYLNQEFDNQLATAIAIFSNQYPRRFFHQLVSSQLDMDRLDYLQRDSYFSGVVEGNIGADRMIRMLELQDDEIVVEEKAIYSIEGFLNARRLMYWQVYLHKTAVAVEQMLIAIIKRVKYLLQFGVDVPATPVLLFFLENKIGLSDFLATNQTYDSLALQNFIQLDDYDVWGSIKLWATHPDKVLAMLSNMLLKRQIFKARIENDKYEIGEIAKIKQIVQQKFGLDQEEINYFVLYGSLTNAAYIAGSQKINILKKNGEVIDIVQAADLPNVKAMSKLVKKYYLCYPK
jgi:HD superfamily phosphohydrolase